ncbi:MAG: (d)CMP kinase, partial [Gemmatimonadales bacterium]
FVTCLEGVPVEDMIRDPDVTAQVSAVAAVPAVRDWVNSHLRELVSGGIDVVVDGRDIGTVVFPEAELKIFLTASPVTRAERRIRQRGHDVEPRGLQRESDALEARDRADSAREAAPLRMGEDAIALDGTGLTFQEQVERIVGLARERFGITHA